jgi:hypothetical protein
MSTNIKITPTQKFSEAAKNLHIIAVKVVR